MSKPKPPTYAETISELLVKIRQPISIDELIDEFLEIRVPKTKDPRSSIRSKIREENGRLLIFSDDDHILPIDIAYRKIHFRIKITKKMLFKRMIPLDEFELYFSGKLPIDKLKFLDEDGSALDAKIFTITKRENSPFGSFDETHYSLDLNSWFKKLKAKANDHIIVSIHDYQSGTLRLSLEAAAQFNQDLVAAQNQQLADIIYDLLECDNSEMLMLRTAIPTAYARLLEKMICSPNSVGQIIAQDDRMVYDGWHIVYADSQPSLLERIMADELGISTVPAPIKFSADEGQQIYRFKIALKYRKGLWRKIEIQGEQTMAEFNNIIMNAFNYDWDHMGGFWKLVPRRAGSKRTRYREVDIGSVNPFGGGDGADIPIAGLELSVGDRLKYVYDFGDWIEHEITLEAIEKPQTDLEYPRITAQNKPRYQYCQNCKKINRKTIATWICFTCSNKMQVDVLVCEDCLNNNHSEHFADEIIY